VAKTEPTTKRKRHQRLRAIFAANPWLEWHILPQQKYANSTEAKEEFGVSMVETYATIALKTL
jgi:hypothetical protein